MNDQHAQVVALIEQQPAGPDGGDGLASYLHRLCSAAALALTASGVGLNVMAEGGVRGLTAASDPGFARIDELQFTLGEGPCIDSFADRRPVLVPDIGDGAVGRWPVYAPAAYDGGVRAVFAFPLQIGAGRLGVLGILRARTGPLTADELRQALVFADVAVATLLDGRDHPYGRTGTELAEAMDSRAVLFQAQGMVMVQIGGTLAEALARMRAHAYAENRPLGDVARDVVGRRLRFEQDRP